MAKVTVYSMPMCPACVFAKNFLKDNNIVFKGIDVSKNSNAANEMIKISGQMSVPVITINKKIIIGFDKDKLKKALNL